MATILRLFSTLNNTIIFTKEITLMATKRGNLGNQEYPSVLNTLGDIFQWLSGGYNPDRGVAIP